MKLRGLWEFLILLVDFKSSLSACKSSDVSEDSETITPDRFEMKRVISNLMDQRRCFKHVGVRKV